MKKKTEGPGRKKVQRIMRKLVDLFLESADREEPKITVQDFLRVASALNETEADELIEEIRVTWIEKQDADV